MYYNWKVFFSLQRLLLLKKKKNSMSFQLYKTLTDSEHLLSNFFSNIYE